MTPDQMLDSVSNIEALPEGTAKDAAISALINYVADNGHEAEAMLKQAIQTHAEATGNMQ